MSCCSLPNLLQPASYCPDASLHVARQRSRAYMSSVLHSLAGMLLTARRLGACRPHQHATTVCGHTYNAAEARGQWDSSRLWEHET